MRPRLLDLFCGAGGAGKGYADAGFEVVGVDVRPQPRYPFEFVQGDALELMRRWLTWAKWDGKDWGPDHFDAVHASPPCQAYTSLRRLGKGAGDGAPALIAPVRTYLEVTGLPYVIENVPEARSALRDPTTICGSSLGLDVRRHRLFETNWPLLVPRCSHGARGRPLAVYGDHPQDGSAGHINRARTLGEGQRAMDIDWMTWAEITQAIPPAYTEVIGHQLMQHVRASAPLIELVGADGSELPHEREDE